MGSYGLGECRSWPANPYRGRMSTETSEPPAVTFADLGLGDRVLKSLREVGYESPSSIQERTIPPLLEGRDLVGVAQTGTSRSGSVEHHSVRKSL